MSDKTDDMIPVYDNPSETNTLIAAMEAAGYTFDSLESTDDNLRFFGEGGQTMTMGGWKECEDWLNGVVFDDPQISDHVESILHPDRFPSSIPSALPSGLTSPDMFSPDLTMRRLEDQIEQNDNSFDGIINNLPTPPVRQPDPIASCRAASEEADRKSVLEKLKEQQKELEERAHGPRIHPRGWKMDSPERSLT